MKHQGEEILNESRSQRNWAMGLCLGLGLYLGGSLALAEAGSASPGEGSGSAVVPLQEPSAEEAPPDSAGGAEASEAPRPLPSFTKADLEAAREAWKASGAGGEEPGFRLFSSRRIDPRMRPLGAMRPQVLSPIFSPVTTDFLNQSGAATRYDIRASVSWLAVDGERDSAKFQEFRDLTDGPVVGLDGQYRSEEAFFHLVARHLGLDDQDVRVRGGHFGKYRLDLFYTEIPHRFAFDARSLYSGIGSGDLVISDTIQQHLTDSTSPVDAAERIREAVDQSGFDVDLGLVRERFGVDLDILAGEPVTIEVKTQNESRQGVRPWSGSFGFSNFVEIPWPVDYDTDEAKLSIEYAKNYVFLNASFYLSSFDNNIDTVSFDNPWRTSDSSPPGAVFSNFSGGAARGLIDLYPSNDFQNFSLTGAITRLPLDSTLSGSVSFGTMEQDDALVPFTTNTAVVPGASGNPPFDASDPANLPTSRANAEIDTELLQLRFTSQPNSLLRLNAHYRRYATENKTERIFLPGFVLEDGEWRAQATPGASFSNLPIDFARTTGGVDLSFSLLKGTRLTVGYTLEEVERDFREVAKTDEDRFKVSLDTRTTAWLELRASYETASRDASPYDFAKWHLEQGNDILPVLPTLFKFDQADRDRDRLQILATFTPTPNLLVSTALIQGEDEFAESNFGLEEDEHQIYSLDASYVWGERLSLYASYSFETYEAVQSARAWVPFGPGDPFRVETGIESPSNWRAETIDDVDTLGFGLEAELIPDKLGIDLAFSFSQTDGEIRYDSPLGAVDLTPFIPAPFTEVDDVEFYSLNPELDYKVGDRLSVTLGYLREQFDIDDFNYEGFSLVPTTLNGRFNGALLMGTLFPSYNTNVVYATINLGLRRARP